MKAQRVTMADDCISTKDELPIREPYEPAPYVLAWGVDAWLGYFTNREFGWHKAYYDEETGDWIKEGNRIIESVTHWMPLPEPQETTDES